MDGDRKKRKKDDNAAGAAEEEEDEEEKMEKFFALIRSTRDVKERMLMSGSANVSQRLGVFQGGGDVYGKQILGDENKTAVAVWNPTFQPEDFMDDRGHPARVPTPDHPNPPPPPLEPSSTELLNLNIIPRATRDGEGAATAGPSRTKTEEDGVEDDHDLDLKLSL